MMEWLLQFAMVVYIVTGFISIRIAYKFYKTINGKLRKALISLFGGIGIALLIRGMWGMFELTTRINTNGWVSLLAIGIVFVTMFRFLLTTRKYHKK